MKFLKYTIILLVMSSSACNVTPDFVKPTVNIPSKWRDENLITKKTTDEQKWWQAFGSSK